MNTLFQKRFKELELQLKEVETTKTSKYSAYTDSTYENIDTDQFLNWKIKVKDLLIKIVGENSIHYKTFLEAEKVQAYEDTFTRLKRVKAVFLAAKEDFEGGYLYSLRNLVEAEIFDSELEQAQELLTAGYILASAIIAGVVLETSIKSLCIKNNIDTGKLDKMNADLAKASVYNKLNQKKITALADIRNSAAHGNIDSFTKEDVKKMIQDVQDLISSFNS